MDQCTVLVVEDDDSIRGLLVELLTNVGYTVLQADGGRIGLSMAEDHEPSVVLINHHLPDMSGLDVLEHLRRRPSTHRIPVVLVSGRSHQLDGQPHGADKVVPMPFDIDVLLGHIENLALLREGSPDLGVRACGCSECRESFERLPVPRERETLGATS